MADHTLVERRVRATYLDGSGEIAFIGDVYLTYDPSDPLRVAARFGGSWTADVVWTFARQLLSDAFSGREAGVGDLRVTVDAGMVRLDFYLNGDAPDDGSASRAVVLAVADVEAFLDDSFAAVPEGTETVDVDAWLVGLLDGAL